MSRPDDPGVALAKLVVASLGEDNGTNEFRREFTVCRGHNPVDEIKTLTTTPKLIVMPGDRRREVSTRATKIRTVTLWVAVLAKLAPNMGSRTEINDDLSDFEDLTAFVTELEEWFVPNNEAAHPVVCFSNDAVAFDVASAETEPDYMQEFIGKGVFASIIKIECEQTAT